MNSKLASVATALMLVAAPAFAQSAGTSAGGGSTSGGPAATAPNSSSAGRAGAATGGGAMHHESSTTGMNRTSPGQDSPNGSPGAPPTSKEGPGGDPSRNNDAPK